MKIAEFSVKNYQFTIIIFVMVMTLGISSLLTMPKSEDPSMNTPQFVAVAVLPGTSPADMEELIVDPIEEAFDKLDDMKLVTTNIDDGLMVMIVEFEYGSDADEKYSDLLRELNNIRPNLPEGIARLQIRKFSPADVSIMQLALLSETASYRELEKYADDLKERLEKVKGLHNNELHAIPEQQVRVSLNIEKMAQLKLPVNRVLQVIQSENLNIPAGSVDVGPKKFNVKTSGNFESLDEIRNAIVQTTGAQVVRLGEIADVQYADQEETYIARLNGQRAVFVTTSMKDGGNIFDVRDQVYPVLDEFAASLPPHISFQKSFDQSVGVEKRMGGFTRDFLIAIFLVLLTLLPLGFRASVVVMISIPLSLAIGLFLLDLAGFTINQLSIVGLVIALGLLVDDSIVVVENIERFLRDGHSKKDAAILATKQIGLAVVGCTAVLIFAFLPLTFLPEAAGEFIRSLPMAVITTVLASLFVSITIVPFLSSLILSNKHGSEGNIFLRGLKWMISGSYRKLLHKAIAHPIMTLAIAFGIFLGSLALIPVVGFSVFPKSEKPQFLITIEAPLGTSLTETNRIAQDVEKVLSQKPHLVNFATNVGKGNPRIYYNVTQRNDSPNYAELFVQVEEMEMQELEQYVEDLRQDFDNYAGAQIEVKLFEQGPPLNAPIEIRILGENLDSLRAVAFRLEEMLKRIDGTTYINNPLKTLGTDLKVNINKDKAGMIGLPVAEVDQTVRMAISGVEMGTFKDEESDEYPINISVPKGQRVGPEVFDKIYIASVPGELIPLRQVADVQMQASPTTIRHYDKQRFVVVQASVKSGYLTNDVTQQVVKAMETFPLPNGYTYNFGGELENSQESFGGLGPIIIIALYSILAILLLEFRTFKSTMIVLSVIPLGIIGAVLILLLSGNTFSFTSVVGIIALMGIEIKNSILLVDYTNQLRADGMNLDEAIEVAGETRFIPIILTTLTAIGGLMPLVIENSPLYSPLALVIIGGLISSTLLTRVVTPVLYKLLPPKVDYLIAKKEAATA